ncbi:MAG: hypothetical protein ABIV51_01630 [Saprospiraceae bacterium]
MGSKLFHFLLLLSFSFFLSSSISAQAYNSAIGLRIDNGLGISVKQRITNRGALEGIMQSSWRNDEVRLTLVWEEHRKILLRNLSLYFGGGLHKGFYDRQEIIVKNPFGVTAIAGLELTIGRFNVSYDFKPALNITGGFNVIEAQTGLSVRYVLDKRPMAKGKKGNDKNIKNKPNKSSKQMPAKRKSSKV